MQLFRARRLLFVAMVYVRKLVLRAVLRPGDGSVAVEDERGMSVALANETLLPRRRISP